MKLVKHFSIISIAIGISLSSLSAFCSSSYMDFSSPENNYESLITALKNKDPDEYVKCWLISEEHSREVIELVAKSAIAKVKPIEHKVLSKTEIGSSEAILIIKELNRMRGPIHDIIMQTIFEIKYLKVENEWKIVTTRTLDAETKKRLPHERTKPRRGSS